MIDEKKLIEMLRYDISCFETDGMKDSEMYIRADDMIRMIEGQLKIGEWVPVSERLPEDGTYICTLDGELVGQEETFTGMCGIENGIWDEPDCVIAWMPLPEPYKFGISKETEQSTAVGSAECRVGGNEENG